MSEKDAGLHRSPYLFKAQSTSPGTLLCDIFYASLLNEQYLHKSKIDRKEANSVKINIHIKLGNTIKQVYVLHRKFRTTLLHRNRAITWPWLTVQRQKSTPIRCPINIDAAARLTELILQ